MSRLPVWVAVAALLTPLSPIAGSAGPAGAAPAPAPTATTPSAAAPSRAVIGAQTVGDSLFPHQGNGGYDVEHYRLDLRWSASRAISATARITATTTRQPLAKFSFDLEGLRVTAVSVDGDRARFSRVASGDKHKLVVTPRSPVSGRFTATVIYSGTPVTHVDPDGSSEGWVGTGSGATSGVVALNEPVGAMTWFPNNNTPRDKATFSTRVTVPYSAAAGPQNRTVVSNGLMDDVTQTSTTRTFTWRQPRQQATYLAFVGIGPYAVAESDVALTDGTTREWSYRDSAISDQDAGFTTARDKLSEILRSIEGHYGPYPGASTGVVVDTVPSGVNYALETQDRPFFPSSIDEATLVHELAHQWFGNAVSPTDWSDVWLNEGPATYLETQVGEALYGGPSTQDTYYDTWNTSTTGSLWSVPSAGFDDPSILFDTQVYTRGAVALEALRSALGDAVFDRVMRTWLQTYGGRSATTAQFIALAERVSGHDLRAFFQTWIYGTTKPTAWPVAYELSLTSSPATGATIDPDAAVSYTLTAQNSGKVSTGTSRVTIDATELLAQGTLGTLPAGVTRSGDTLVWAVPATAVGETASVVVPATIDHPLGGSFAVSARGRTLGADCGTCASTLTVSGGGTTSTEPVVGGTPRVGETLTAITDGWSDGTTFTYQWLRSGNPIAGATRSTYDAGPSASRSLMSVRVVGSRGDAQPVTRTSRPVRIARGLQDRTPVPVVRGQAITGRTLLGYPGAHDPGTTLDLQWLIDGRRVPGATTSRFTIRTRDRGRIVQLRSRSTKPGYEHVDRLSTPLRVR